MNHTSRYVSNILPEKSGEITPERMDRAKAKTTPSCGYAS